MSTEVNSRGGLNEEEKQEKREERNEDEEPSEDQRDFDITDPYITNENDPLASRVAARWVASLIGTE